MKKLLGFFLMALFFYFASCSADEAEISWETAHEYTLENIMGEKLDQLQFTQTPAITTHTITKPDGSKVFRGTQITGSMIKNNNQWTMGMELHFHYSFEGDMYAESFSNEMFEALWSEGMIHKLGVGGSEFLEESFLTVAIENEHGKMNEYITEVNASNDGSQIEIIARNYTGKNAKGQAIYEIVVGFSSRMVNKNDPMDIIYIKNGKATLKVPSYVDYPIS